MAPGLSTDSAFVIHSLPVMRFSGFTSANRPQKVKKTDTSIPEAAAVVDRMRVGQMRSRWPSQATIVILFFLLNPSRASRSASARSMSSVSSVASVEPFPVASPIVMPS